MKYCCFSGLFFVLMGFVSLLVVDSLPGTPASFAHLNHIVAGAHHAKSYCVNTTECVYNPSNSFCSESRVSETEVVCNDAGKEISGSCKGQSRGCKTCLCAWSCGDCYDFAAHAPCCSAPGLLQCRQKYRYIKVSIYQDGCSTVSVADSGSSVGGTRDICF